MTNNVDRGTIVFMALESMSSWLNQKVLSLQDLKKADIWSLGMIMFMFLDPDLQWPYQFKLDQLQNKNLEESKKDLVRRF